MKIKLINLILSLLIFCPLYCYADNMVTYTYRAGTGIQENQESDTKEIREEAPKQPEIKYEQQNTVYVPVYPANYNPYYYQYTYPGYVGTYYTNPNYYNSGNFSFNYSGFGFSYGNTYYRNPLPSGGKYPPPPPPPPPTGHPNSGHHPNSQRPNNPPPNNGHPPNNNGGHK